MQLLGSGAPRRRELVEVPPRDEAATLTLRVVGGEGLAARDANGRSDPYCEVHAWSASDAACAHVWRTATDERTLAPRWDGEDEALTAVAELRTREYAVAHAVAEAYVSKEPAFVNRPAKKQRSPSPDLDA